MSLMDGEHYLEFILVFFRFTMEAGKQQAKPMTKIQPVTEIQPPFRNLDIGQLVQGKTLTVGNLLDWQRTVIQAVESAKSGSAPISLVPVTTTFQPATMIKPVVQQKVTVQTGPAIGIATSVPVIRAVSTERMTVPDSKPLTSVISNNFSGQNMTGSVLNSMIHSVTSLMHSSGAKNEELLPKSPTSPQAIPMTVSRSPAILNQSTIPSVNTQQVTSSVNTPTEVPTTFTEAAQISSPTPPSKSLFKLSGRTLVTILPSGSGESKNNSSHKVFGEDTFTPIDSYGAGAFEAGSPTSGDAKMTEKVTTSPKGSSSGRARNESTESNTNKNNNNSTPTHSVKVKQENDSGDSSSATASTSKKGKTSSRGRNIKNTAIVYAESSDNEDDDVFLHTTSKPKHSKSKRSAYKTTNNTFTTATNNDATESDQESMQCNYICINLLTCTSFCRTVNDVLLYSIHMTNSG